MRSPVIIALDFPGKKEVEAFIEPFEGQEAWVKVGMELFYGEGPQLVSYLKEKRFRIFLDLKLHDIPTTVRKAMERIAALGVDMVNVHAAGGREMMRGAIEGLEAVAGPEKRPLCIAVTQLTSTSSQMLKDELLIGESMESAVSHYAKLAKESGLDGVVCSPLEVPYIKKVCGQEFLTVTPGIRLKDDDKNDQKRTADPAGAKELGSDYIVVGRSITGSLDPLQTYVNIEKEWGILHETTNR
ncbi:orotidine-5'-phosphate decarboxylase [Fictibacillus sp. KIGAM418]|uniref:Orotidine 5'-phosphate decarboxylase n=1 Tax=Fictibacillus marinisediminis TaxID=2878389 RepID=A0A9X2BGX0_9BACL|nr:orotidine-5'-phosphate decarboxylase [Fictibacillus marinisediminis]MCK6256948.1 orotidine-5'-phosphate decarboxylase [Fictibacillus marinisediminis]